MVGIRTWRPRTAEPGGRGYEGDRGGAGAREEGEQLGQREWLAANITRAAAQARIASSKGQRYQCQARTASSKGQQYQCQGYGEVANSSTDTVQTTAAATTVTFMDLATKYTADSGRRQHTAAATATEMAMDQVLRYITDRGRRAALRKTTDTEHSLSKPTIRSTAFRRDRNTRMHGPGWTAGPKRGPGTWTPAPTRSQQGSGADISNTVQQCAEHNEQNKRVNGKDP